MILQCNRYANILRLEGSHCHDAQSRLSTGPTLKRLYAQQILTGFHDLISPEWACCFLLPLGAYERVLMSYKLLALWFAILAKHMIAPVQLQRSSTLFHTHAKALPLPLLKPLSDSSPG